MGAENRRTLAPLMMVSFDRRGEIFRSFDGAGAVYSDGANTVLDGAHPYVSWTHVHAHNIQTNRMTRLEQLLNEPMTAIAAPSASSDFSRRKAA